MSKKICILGSGLVSSSVINFFCREPDSENLYAITIGSIIERELKELEAKYPNIKTVLLDVTTDKEVLFGIIEASDIVISLLTNEMQFHIAKVCIALKVNMVHASYCTTEMMALDADAKLNGVTILNELGLDPGIDHLLAMKAIDEIHKEGSKVTAFISYCGGLPEPKLANCNPLRYKFSWSPFTSLRNLLNSARYLKDTKVVEIPAGGALINAIEASADDFLDDRIQLEAYPNRDSLEYKELYGIQEASTIVRGTYRYKGFKETVKALFKLGLFSQQSTEPFQENGNIKTWGNLIVNMLSNNEENQSSLVELLYQHGYSKTDVDKFEKLGILSTKGQLRLKNSLLETFADHLTDTLKYDYNERDMVIMRHEIRYTKRNEERERSQEILFVAYGEQDKGGFSAMSKTVGLTIGHAVKLLLKGAIQRTGVIYPFTDDIYRPILRELYNEGLNFTEKHSIPEQVLPST